MTSYSISNELSAHLLIVLLLFLSLGRGVDGKLEKKKWEQVTSEKMQSVY
jgi:hypothetical protein